MNVVQLPQPKLIKPEFTEDEANQLLALLNELPHKQVRVLIDKILVAGTPQENKDPKK